VHGRIRARQSDQLDHDALHGTQGGEIHDALVADPDDRRQPPHDVERHLGVLEQERREVGRGNGGQDTVGACHHAGGPGLVVDRRQLAEEVPGAEVGVRHRPAGYRVVDDLDHAVDDEIDVAVLAGPLDDLVPFAVAVPAAMALHLGQFVRLQRGEQRDPRQPAHPALPIPVTSQLVPVRHPADPAPGAVCHEWARFV
jgi:hypothetical protein